MPSSQEQNSVDNASNNENDIQSDKKNKVNVDKLDEDRKNNQDDKMKASKGRRLNVLKNTLKQKKQEEKQLQRTFDFINSIGQLPSNDLKTFGDVLSANTKAIVNEIKSGLEAINAELKKDDLNEATASKEVLNFLYQNDKTNTQQQIKRVGESLERFDERYNEDVDPDDYPLFTTHWSDMVKMYLRDYLTQQGQGLADDALTNSRQKEQKIGKEYANMIQKQQNDQRKQQEKIDDRVGEILGILAGNQADAENASIEIKKLQKELGVDSIDDEDSKDKSKENSKKSQTNSVDKNKKNNNVQQNQNNNQFKSKQQQNHNLNIQNVQKTTNNSVAPVNMPTKTGQQGMNFNFS